MLHNNALRLVPINTDGIVRAWAISLSIEARFLVVRQTLGPFVEPKAFDTFVKECPLLTEANRQEILSSPDRHTSFPWYFVAARSAQIPMHLVAVTFVDSNRGEAYAFPIVDSETNTIEAKIVPCELITRVFQGIPLL